jgi:hypothetical protein
LSIAVAAVLTGCGGGGSDTASGSAANTGTGHYVDEAISGIDYECGNQNGKTGKDGSFTYEIGKKCRFTIAGVTLRETKPLEKKETTVFEDDANVVYLLAALDDDGDMSNGIHVEEGRAEELKSTMESDHVSAKDILSNTTQLEKIAKKITNDELPSLKKIEEHIDAQRVKMADKLLPGMTLYQHCSDGVAKLVFKTDGKILVYDPGQKVKEVPYTIQGDVVTTTEIKDGKKKIEHHKLVAWTDKEIKFIEESEETTLFYFSEEAAKKAPAQNCGDDNDDEPHQFSHEMLDGKTLYFVQYDDFGYDKKQWNAARMVFAKDTFTWQEYDTNDTQKGTFKYKVTTDGKLILEFEGGDNPEDTITLKNRTDDYLQVCEEGDCQTYLFFDEKKALDFRNKKNGN